MSSGFYTPNVVKGIVKKKNVQTHAVKNVYNMRRSTMKIVEEEDGDGHLIEFTIDVEEPCTVCVMWSCEERLDPKTNVTRGFKFAKASKFMRFEKGIGQKVRTKAYPESVSGRSDSFALKEMNLKTHQCSLVIVLTSPSDEREREDGTNEFVVSKQKCQITYAAIGKVKDDKYRAVITQQKMHLNGTCYDLFEIYGIKGGQDEMCVVCMSESKEVAVLPCRHMCLCSECVQELRMQSSKCPICRNRIQAFMYIKSKDDEEEEEEVDEGGPPAPHVRSESLIRDRDEDVSTKESDVELVPL